MPYRSMSLEEFAKHVSMDARDVRRLAKNRELPGHLVGGKWRFNRARVTEWLQQRMHTLSETQLIGIERAMCAAPVSTSRAGAAGSRDADALRSDTYSGFTELIGLDGVDAALPAKTKASALRELVRLAGRTGLLYDESGLCKAVEQRETLCSTALPNGIAIPHPRQPMPYVSAEPFICVGRVSSGIAFGDANGVLSRLFFLVCCHSDRHHLHVLARLMRVLDDPTIDLLLSTETREDMLEVLLTRDQEAGRPGRESSRKAK